MAENFTITNVFETSALIDGGRIADVYAVHYKTNKGVTGKVNFEIDRYTPENVRNTIEELVRTHDVIMDL